MMSANMIDQGNASRAVVVVAVLMSTAVVLGGCATQRKPTSQLQAARTNYNQVENNPEAARSAAESLNRAERELNQAEDLLDSGADMDQVDHHAYLAKRYAQIAQNGVKQADLQDEVKQTKERRRELKLKMRQRKAERAEARANKAKDEAEQAQSEAEKAKSKQAELKNKLSDLQAKQTKRGVVLTLSDVLFAFDKAELKPGGERAAKRLARFMDKYPKRRIRVEGYTDSTGAEAYNRKLSRKRAQAVKDAVVRQGIDSSRIVTHGYGEQYPVAGNETESGRQRNRRVEVVISDQKGELKTRSQNSD